MRVLFVTERFPYPLDSGGNVRTFHVLSALAAVHEVTLIAAIEGDMDEAHRRPVAALCRDVRLVPVANGLIRDLRAFAASFPTAKPFILGRHFSPAVRREIGSILGCHSGLRRDASPRCSGSRFDVVHFNHLDAALYEPAIPEGVRRVVDEHNIVSSQVRTTLKAERALPRRLVLRHEYRKMTRLEAHLCNRMNGCFVCSSEDATSLRNLGVSVPITIVPNGVDLRYFLPGDETGDRTEVVFVGTLDYDPCEKGVWYFCTEVLPLLHRSRPELRFVAVGRNPSSRIRALAAASGRIVLTGRVEDVRPYLRRAGAAVVPLLSGSGTRLKILEAMAVGAPVVSTTIGAEGIEATPGEHLLLADDPLQFAKAVLRLFEDPESAYRMRTSARRLVEEKYGWPAACGALLRTYDSLLQS